MYIAVAPETFQPSVVLSPELMLVGLAVKERITGKEAGGGGAAATVTVTDMVTLPAALVAVRV
jgi:hypothetical protein